MISVEEALTRITKAITPVSSETISLSEAAGRVLSEDLISRRTHPPHDVSAMDGYAVRAADVTAAPATLKQVGEAAAGGAFTGTVGPKEAVRIFTGGTVPKGADTIVLQEDVTAAGETITVNEGTVAGRHIRRGGLDLQAGRVALERGQKLSPRDISLAAAMNMPWLSVYRRPRIALLANGNELVQPGDPIGENQIVSSNSLGLAAMIEQSGGMAIDLGIARDEVEDLQERASRALEADLLVTIGGASVGDHDLVQSSLVPIGLEVDFWKIAMRPGKPLMFGSINKTIVIGLPGNPVSAYVGALLFLNPAIAKLSGQTNYRHSLASYPLGTDISANGSRKDFMRSKLVTDEQGKETVVPFETQDSSMLSILARSDCLLIREAGAPAAKKGDLANVLLFADL